MAIIRKTFPTVSGYTYYESWHYAALGNAWLNEHSIDTSQRRASLSITNYATHPYDTYERKAVLFFNRNGFEFPTKSKSRIASLYFTVAAVNSRGASTIPSFDVYALDSPGQNVSSPEVFAKMTKVKAGYLTVSPVVGAGSEAKGSITVPYLAKALENGIFIKSNLPDWDITLGAARIEISYDNCIDAPPIVSSPTPTGDIVDGDTAQTFSWYYAQEADTPQSHYDIQVNTSDTWTTLVTKAAGTEHRHSFAANALPTGDFQWRVRAYTLGGTVCGEWSNAAAVYVRQTPAAPTITTQSINPRAYFEWTATDQKGYRLRLSDGYDSGTRYGTETNFKLPYFLPDGEVTAFLSIGNSAGKWSKEGAKIYTVANLPRTPILAHAACRNNGVHISFSTDGVYKAFYLLRDGIPIASVSKSDTPFFDAISLGRHVYKVRGDLGTANYTDSAEITVVVRMKDGAMSAVEHIDWIPMRLCANNEPTHEAGASADVAFVFYQGRKKPVAYSMDFETETHTLGYTLCNRAEYAKLRALLGKTVVYKDGRGELLVGTMTELSPSYGRNVDFTVSVTETDYVQEIGYE